MGKGITEDEAYEFLSEPVIVKIYSDGRHEFLKDDEGKAYVRLAGKKHRLQLEQITYFLKQDFPLFYEKFSDENKKIKDTGETRIELSLADRTKDEPQGGRIVYIIKQNDEIKIGYSNEIISIEKPKQNLELNLE
tara:strand:+ start:723 stop:1127 length:405 start_codon:yes stop_codon:yes gene_type:complete